MIPIRLQEFVGQTDIVRKLTVATRASTILDQPVPHMIFLGSGGLGKTTLARIIPMEIKKKFVELNADGLKMAGLVKKLLELKRKEVLFIDEIHKLHRSMFEVLYQAMSDERYITTTINGVTDNMKVHEFTLIVATTRQDMLPEPFLSRFRELYVFQLYTISELEVIIKAEMKKQGFTIEDSASMEIANRARGTPRQAIHLVGIIRDECVVAMESREITAEFVISTFDKNKIWKYGLKQEEHEYLMLVYNSLDKGIGLDNIASCLLIEAKTVKYCIEPYLLRLGFVQIVSGSGRTLTHLGISYVNEHLL